MSSLPPLYPELSLLSTMAYGLEYPTGQFASVFLAVSPPPKKNNKTKPTCVALLQPIRPS